MTRDDFDYALENTRVILAPESQIATFGITSFNFYLISELMDRVNQVRIRNGKIQAERPQILTPEHYCRLRVLCLVRLSVYRLSWPLLRFLTIYCIYRSIFALYTFRVGLESS